MRVRPRGSLPRQNEVAQGGIPLFGKFIPKIPILAIWGLYSHILTHIDEIWREGANLGLSPQAKFYIKSA